MCCVVMCDLILYGAMWMNMGDRKGEGRERGNGRKSKEGGKEEEKEEKMCD